MLTAAVEYPAAMAASACWTSAAERSRSLRAPITVRIGSSMFCGNPLEVWTLPVSGFL